MKQLEGRRRWASYGVILPKAVFSPQKAHREEKEGKYTRRWGNKLERNTSPSTADRHSHSQSPAIIHMRYKACIFRWLQMLSCICRGAQAPFLFCLPFCFSFSAGLQCRTHCKTAAHTAVKCHSCISPGFRAVLGCCLVNSHVSPLQRQLRTATVWPLQTGQKDL